MIKIQVPQYKNKLEQQIKSLKYLIENDTNEKDKKIHASALKDLREELLFQCYLEMQSNEWKEEIIDYKSFKQPGHDICIRVNFTWGWLRVYRTSHNGIEWY
jgi:hypothetical protein